MELANGRSKLKELEKVITEFQNQLFRFAFFRTGSFADSQDIVQDVFLKFYHENKNLESIKNIKHYLYRSIANACVDYHRKTKKLQFETIDTAILPCHLQEQETSEKIIQIEEYKRLNQLLTDLPDEQADVIRLRVFDNLSFVEIASILEIPVTTIKSRFKYGIDKLRVGVTTQKEVNYGLCKM